MATNKGNSIMQGYSGRLGDLVLQKNGILRRRPAGRSAPLSKLQELHGNRFRLSMQYARLIKDDETFREALWRRHSRKTKLPPYQTAIQDFHQASFVKSPLFGLLLTNGGEAEFEITGKGYCITVFLCLPEAASAPHTRKEKAPQLKITNISHTTP